MIGTLAIEEYNEEGYCLGGHSSLLNAKSIGLDHTFTRKPLPKDKALIWCWGGTMVVKELRFYDKKNNGVFDSFGNRDFERKYTNYQAIEPNEQGLYEAPFEWANEAKKKLED